MVVCADEVVAVPGIAVAPGWDGVVTARRHDETESPMKRKAR
jgi:hypothetical protein